jgi:hypothetical protein
MRNGPAINDGADAVLTNHYFVRNGSFWVCEHRCGARQPFPSPVPAPEDLGPCVPRRWGDTHADVPIGRQSTAMDRTCPTCGVPPGEKCIDVRAKVFDPTFRIVRPHPARRRP